MIGTNAPLRSLIASARQIQFDRHKRYGSEWQQGLWEIYQNLGPVHYGMTFKRAAAMRVSYFVAERSDDYDEPIPTENPAAQEALERLGDPAEIIGDFVVQVNVAGEGYLWGNSAEDEFKVISTVELNKRKEDRENPIGESDLLMRLWLASPEYSWYADSPLRSVQAQCEQLLLLNDEISATAMSRVPGGLLLIPSEISFPVQPDEDSDADGDPFMDELIQIVTTAIKDPDSAARVAPNIIRGAAEYLKEIRLVDMARQMDETFANMREELLRQIAGGINLPAEILTGLADLNHWSLWGVDESTAKHHVDPDVLQIMSGLTSGYLWPYLEEAGVANARDYLIWRDYSDLTARPLTIEQAIAMYQEGVINDEYVRQVANVPEDYAGERRPEQQAIPESDRQIPDTLTAAQPQRLTDLARIDQSLGLRITEASEAAFTRALERAGAKVRTLSKKNRQIYAAIDGIDNWDVTRHLGAERIEQLQVTADQLIPADTFDPLRKRLIDMLEKGQDEAFAILERMTGEPIPQAAREQVAQDRLDAVDVFIAALLGAATARLFTNSPALDPAETGEFGDEIATGQMVVELLTRAGGSPVENFTPDTPRGLALGERTRSILRDAGFRVEAQTWEWGFYRTPQTPYEPHQNLNNITVDGPMDPRLNGYYPGDHRFCTCELVPAVLPV